MWILYSFFLGYGNLWGLAGIWGGNVEGHSGEAFISHMLPFTFYWLEVTWLPLSPRGTWEQVYSLSSNIPTEKTKTYKE